VDNQEYQEIENVSTELEDCFSSYLYLELIQLTALWTLKLTDLGIVANHLISWLNFAHSIGQPEATFSDGGFKGFLRYATP